MAFRTKVEYDEMINSMQREIKKLKNENDILKASLEKETNQEKNMTTE